MTIIQRPLSELCVRRIEQRDPKEQPEVELLYVDIGSVSNRTKVIESPKRIKGAQASVRARQIVQADDVLVSTVRPNLNTVALVQPELAGEFCSTGFCVLRCGPELVPGYLFAFVQSRKFVDSLTELVQGALYPAVTEKQVFAQKIPWVEVNEQKEVAQRFAVQSKALVDARNAAIKQIEEIDLLSAKLLAKFF